MHVVEGSLDLGLSVCEPAQLLADDLEGHFGSSGSSSLCRFKMVDSAPKGNVVATSPPSPSYRANSKRPRGRGGNHFPRLLFVVA